MLNFVTWILFLVGAMNAQISKPLENSLILKDGVYTGSSSAKYTDEPYVGTVTIKIENKKIVKVNFEITDTLKHEVFGPDYEKHFPDNELYRQQCRNDWKGIQQYIQALEKKQTIDSVDAISGATWSYNIFSASVRKALKRK
jgi:major membrane immunogen (membrane-anchored lipoprotein)